MPDLSITLIPEQTPIVIPAAGGSFDYNIALANNGATQVTADVWCMVTLPNGSNFGPVLGPVEIIMPVGFSNNRDRAQTVPGSAPPGNYVYHGYIGDYPAKWDSSSFTFDTSCSKSPPQVAPQPCDESMPPGSTSEATMGTPYFAAWRKVLGKPSNFEVLTKSFASA